MGNGRLEAFSDGGIVSIIITIMVLGLKVPHGASFNVSYPTIGFRLGRI